MLPREQTLNIGSVWLFATLFLCGCHFSTSNVHPSIDFTKLPEAIEGGPERLGTIEGRVTGAKSGQRLVLYAKSGVWWVQPFANQPFTSIQPDSTWSAQTHLGTEYAAVLVDQGYQPRLKTDVLPKEGNGVSATGTAKGSEPLESAKTLSFSGYDWEVRNISSARGGTVNEYSPSNVWTDADGFLHLKIAKVAGKWACAEVRLTRSLGYGSYLYVVHDTGKLEPSVVMGMFTWDDRGEDLNHREIDIEISRWGDPASQNSQYVIQPYYVPANVVRFLTPSGVVTHSFRWEPGQVAFKSVSGSGITAKSTTISDHLFKSGIPSPGNESVHMNLYVYNNAANPIQNENEVVIEKFEFLP